MSSANQNEMMEKVDMEKDFAKFSPTDQHYIKKAERLTLSKATAHRNLRNKNYLVAGGLLAFAAAIYGYSITSVRQEKFLDQYDDMHKKN